MKKATDGNDFVEFTVQGKQSWCILPILQAFVYGILTKLLIVAFTAARSFSLARALHMRSRTGEMLASPKYRKSLFTFW